MRVRGLGVRIWMWWSLGSRGGGVGFLGGI